MEAIGPYRIAREVGRGGSGAVHQGVAPDGRPVAVKVLHPGWAELAERFARERRLQSSLGLAEGFVPLHDAGVHRGRPYLVMPFLPGGTLRDRLQRGPLPVEEVVALGRALARALGEAHARGVVHRDVKPENVLFDGAGRPLLSDLGLARHFRRDLPGATHSRALTEDGSLVGTPGYAALEQLEGAADVGPPADVFALAAVLYEALTGARPFERHAGLLELAQRQRQGPPPLDRRLVPAWLAQALERALSPLPADRQADGAALLRTLEPPAPALRRRPGAGALGLAALAAVALVAATLRAAAWRRGTSRAGDEGGVVAVGSPATVDPRASAAPTAPTPRPAGAPDDAAALLARARDAAARCDHLAALRLLDQAISLAPSGEAYLERAWVRLSAEGADRVDARGVPLPHAAHHHDAPGGEDDALAAAERDCRQAWERSQRGPALHVAWATALWLQDQHDRAAEEATSALRLDEDYVAANLVRGAARLALGQFARALEDLDRYLGRVHTGGRAYGWRALAHRGLGNIDQALADCQRAVELGNDDPAVEETWAELCLEVHDAEGAVRHATRALEGGCTTALVPRADALAARGDLQAALADGEAAVRHHPDEAEAFVARGRVRLELDDLDGALADAQQAETLDPRDYEAVILRAQVRDEQRSPRAAVEAWTHALSLAPRGAEWDLRHCRGHSRVRAGDLAGALQDFERLLELDPTDSSGWEGRAEVRMAQGIARAAQEDATRALELGGHDLSALVTRGQSRAALGDVDGARADCRRALELAHDHHDDEFAEKARAVLAALPPQ